MYNICLLIFLAFFFFCNNKVIAGGINESTLYMKVSYLNNDVYYPVKRKFLKIKKNKKENFFITFNFSNYNSRIDEVENEKSYQFSQENHFFDFGLGVEKIFFHENHFSYFDYDLIKSKEVNGLKYNTLNEFKLGYSFFYVLMLEIENIDTNIVYTDYSEINNEKINHINGSLGLYYNGKFKLSYGMGIDNKFVENKVYRMSYKFLQIKNMVTELGVTYNKLKYEKDDVNYNKESISLRIGIGWAF